MNVHQFLEPIIDRRAGAGTHRLALEAIDELEPLAAAVESFVESPAGRTVPRWWSTLEGLPDDVADVATASASGMASALQRLADAVAALSVSATGCASPRWSASL
jgi:hypothetical protein